MKFLIWIAYLVCIAFIVSGALNYGSSRFVMAVPFIIAACFMAWKYSSGRMLFYATIVFSLTAIIVNLTIEKNPLVFPVIDGGQVEILVDGFYLTDSDGNGAFFTAASCSDPSLPGHCGWATTSTFIKAGTVYKVKGVNLTSSGVFVRGIDIIIEPGYSLDRSLIFSNEIKTDKEVVNPLLANTGIFMAWPIFFIEFLIKLTQA